jgi:hypothetical protein
MSAPRTPPRFVPPLRSDAVGSFLALLRHPAGATVLDDAAWDAIVRVGRGARLLAALGARLEALGMMSDVPPRVRAHFESEAAVARHRAAIAAYELHEVGRVLAPLALPCIALKGVGYAMQGLAMARGRLFADVDILVPQRDLDRVEAALLAAGWEMEPLDPHDARYYREWAHELPPLVFPGRGVEVDVHHALLPRTSRLAANVDALFAHARPAVHAPWQVLAPEDQVVHAAAQLFHDADLASRLRDLADLDGLLRAFQAQRGFWDRLALHARLHRLERPLWYALRYVPAYLGTPVPDDVRDALVAPPPHACVTAMDALVARAVLPGDPDLGTTRGQRLARAMLYARSHWLRMPPGLLASHAVNKLARRWRATPAPAAPPGGAA